MPKLKRALGLFEVTIYGVGIILGAGIYALIGHGAAVAGNSLWIAFLIAAVIACLTGLSYAELSSLFPKEAAEYVYVKKAFNLKSLSFLIGWLIIFVETIAASTIALGFAGYFFALFQTPIILTAAVLILLLSLLNFYGIKHSARINIIFTAIEMLGLIIIIFLGIPYFGQVGYFEMPAGMIGVFSAAILIFFAYIGFEDMVNIAEETKNPKKTIPKAIIFSIAITTIIYILVSMSVVSVLPWQELGKSAAPLADVASATMPGGAFLLSIIALFATANTVLIMLIVASRMVYGMAEQGAIPKFLGAVHAKTRTPHKAVFLVMAFSILFVLFGNIKLVAQLTDFGIFIIFGIVNAALIWLRYKRPKLKRPFKVPINIGKFPLLPFLGLIFCFGMLFYFELAEVLFGAFIILFGLLVYFLVRRKK